MRFGRKHREQEYRLQLKNRSPKSTKSLQEYQANVFRLISCAYPTVPDEDKSWRGFEMPKHSKQL